MSDAYTRQHTFVNGATADGGEIEDEFVAIDAAIVQVQAEIASLGLGSTVPVPTPSDAYEIVTVNSGGSGFITRALADIKTWLGLGSLAYLSAVPDGSITPAKQADYTADTFLARASGTGVPSLYSMTSIGRSFVAAATALAQANIVLPDITADTTITVGSGGTYATIGAAIEYLRSVRVKSGVVITISILSAVTETTKVAFPAGIKISLLPSSSLTVTGLVAVTGEDAFYIPRSADVTVAATAYTLTLDCSINLGTGNPRSTLCHEGKLTLLAPLALTCSGTDKVDGLLYSFGGLFFGDDTASYSSSQIILNDDGQTNAAGKIRGGAVYGVRFVAHSTAQTNQLYFYSAAVTTAFGATSLTQNFYGCAVRAAAGTGTYVRRLIGVYSGTKCNISGSPSTLTASSTVLSHFISGDSSDLVLGYLSINITSADAACTRCVDATACSVTAFNGTFTGQGGDYALYGSGGSTLKGSGNTYTTLTGSNLNGTWAVGGNYLNA